MAMFLHLALILGLVHMLGAVEVGLCDSVIKACLATVKDLKGPQDIKCSSFKTCVYPAFTCKVDALSPDTKKDFDNHNALCSHNATLYSSARSPGLTALLLPITGLLLLAVLKA